MKLYLENVRSFVGWHEIPISPATVLLGENSAGKTTLLGILSIVNNEAFPKGRNLFNQFPFEFGSFKTIASSKKGVGTFSIGYETEGSARFMRTENRKAQSINIRQGIVAEFRDVSGLPSLVRCFAWLDDVAVEWKNKSEPEKSFEKLKLPKGIKIVRLENEQDSALDNAMRRLLLDYPPKNQEDKEQNKEQNQKIDELVSRVIFGYRQTNAIAFAPMRSRPKRTYDQISDEFSAEGEHVPLLLARATDSTSREAKVLHESIKLFGKTSEMFNDVTVKRLGKGSGDPFQIQVEKGKKKPNLMDVGYGVSQVLPLLVDAQRARSGSLLLLQQPEVHLHPKAQAAIGTMIGEWVSKDNKKVVVETHSDYLVDRLRLEVKKKKLKPHDLLILYVENDGVESKVHKLSVDEEGNIRNAPEGYRDFFMQEMKALLVD